MNENADFFKFIHNLQTTIIKKPTKQLLNEYHQHLNQLYSERKQLKASKDDVKNLLDFLLFPLLTSLKKQLAEFKNPSVMQNDSMRASLLRDWSDVCEYHLKSIYFLLNRYGSVSEKNLFYELFGISSILLSIKKNPIRIKKDHGELEVITCHLSDEFFVQLFKLIQFIFDPNHTNSQILDSFYSFRNLTSLALLVSVLLDTLCETTSPEVRLEAISTLKSLSCYKKFDLYHLGNDSLDPSDYKSRIGTLFSTFLPGICINLIQKFMMKQNMKLLNHKIICGSLELLGHLIGEILNDGLLNGDLVSKLIESCSLDCELSNELKAMIVNRNENKEWLANSTSKVSILLETLLDQLILNENYFVQLDLCRFSSLICHKSYFSLNSFLPNCLKVLVTFIDVRNSSDEENEPAKISMKTIEQMESKEETIDKMRSSSSTSSCFMNQFSLMSTCVNELLIKLPRIMNKELYRQNEIDDRVRINHLRLLLGYLKLIGGKNLMLKDFFMSNLDNLNQLLQALISCVWFDYKNLNNFYEINVIDTNNNNNNNKSGGDDDTSAANRLSNYSGLRTYLSDKIVYDQLNQICDYLGKSDALHLLIDEFLTNDLLSLQHQQNRTEIMFLINLILNGATSTSNKSNNNQQTTSIVKFVLDYFIDDYKSNKASDQVESNRPSNENQAKIISENENDDDSTTTTNWILGLSVTNKRNRRIIQTCLMLEVISAFSRFLKVNKESQHFLINTIFITLENYLNRNLLIRCVSTECLKNLALNLNYSSIQDLLSVNYDYIMNDLILKSYDHYKTMSKSVAITDAATTSIDSLSSHVYVLCSLLQISNSDLVPYLDRLLNDYIAAIELNNSNDSHLLYGLCKIMLEMSKSMRRWYPVKLNFIDMNSNLNDIDQLININLKNYAEAKRKPDYSRRFVDTIKEVEKRLNSSDERSDEDLLADSNETNDERGGDEENKEEEEEKNKKPPLNVDLQLRCLNLCQHLISHPFRQIRLMIVDVIREICFNLAERENDLLPVVYKLWSPICKRFGLDDYVMKSKIMILLFDMSIFCTDFLANNFRKDFLPHLIQFMSDQSKQSQRAVAAHDSTYVYSQAFKLQCAIMNNIDKMCVLFEIRELELENLITTSIAVYLDEKQPKRLRELSLNALNQFSLVDSDIVWLCISYIINNNNNSNSSIKSSTSLKSSRIKSIKPSSETLDRLNELYDQL